MIKHASSLFISLTLHTLILFLLFYSWKNIPIFHKKEAQNKVCVKLHCIVEEKVEHVLKKIDTPKQQEKIVKKEIKKIVPKKVKTIKEEKITVPVVKDKVLPKKEIIQEIEEMPEATQEPVQEKNIETVSYEEVQKEDEYTRSKRVNKEYIDANIQKIVKLLSDNLYYPRSARKRGITGDVIVKFELSTEAKVNSIEIVTSENDILSRAAIKTLEDLSGKFPKPNEALVLEVPINYNLKN